MNVCEVREPTQADKADILHLIEGQLDVFEGPYDRPAIDDAKDACRDIGDLTDGQSLVAIDQDTGLVIGFGRLTGSQGSYALTHLFVAGYEQGKGVGKRLWKALIEGKPSGAVVVKSSPGAVDVYKKMGFGMSGASIPGSPLKTLVFKITS